MHLQFILSFSVWYEFSRKLSLGKKLIFRHPIFRKIWKFKWSTFYSFWKSRGGISFLILAISGLFTRNFRQYFRYSNFKYLSLIGPFLFWRKQCSNWLILWPLDGSEIPSIFLFSFRLRENLENRSMAQQRANYSHDFFLNKCVTYLKHYILSNRTTKFQLA